MGKDLIAAIEILFLNIKEKYERPERESSIRMVALRMYEVKFQM